MYMTMGWSLRCYIPSFVKIGLPVLEKKIFEGFLQYIIIWAWGPSLSCDPDAANIPNKLSFPLPKPQGGSTKFGFDRASGFREDV